MLLLYASTLFVSATLLFLVQPMFAKMALPIMGGTPFMWNTCMVFFQASLLAGYGYAHLITRQLGVRHQAALHMALLSVSLVALPIAVRASGDPPAQENPIFWLLLLLLLSIGLPFFVLSASSPLLQKWFTHTGHLSAKDPYFLYAASNLGSMIALIAYPLLLEPNLRLANQSLLWAGGYGLLIALMIGCAAILWRSRAVTPTPVESSGMEDDSQTIADAEEGISTGRRLR